MTAASTRTAQTIKGLDLVGPAEIAHRLNVRAQTVAVWKVRGLLPPPALVVSNVPVWPWAVIVKWARDTGRLAEH